MDVMKGINTIVNRVIYGERKMVLINKPVFIKAFSKENQQIEDLKEILLSIEDQEKKERITRDISYLKLGMIGEQNVSFELKNTNAPLLCLHDLRLEYDGMVAQMDFVVLTKQYICVLETKQLQGNIDLDKEGNFIRVYTDQFGKTTRTGMYSPVEQNKKHVNLLKRILEEKFNISKMPVKSLVVMANAKAIIGKDNAPKEVQEQIIRAENLSNCLVKWIEEIDCNLKEQEVFTIARYLKENHKPLVYNYEVKYKLNESRILQRKEKSELGKDQSKGNVDILLKSKEIEKENVDILRNKLKRFRLETSRKENCKAYLIFNNMQMEEVIERNPKNCAELMKIRGFGEKKVERYGEEIIRLLKEES